MVSRDRRDPIVLQKVRKQGIKFCHDSPKSKKTRNKILAQMNTKDSCKFNPYFWLVSHYGMFAKMKFN